MKDLWSMKALAVLLVLSCCKPAKPGYVSKPTRSVLNPETDLLDVKTVVHHLDDSLTRLFLQITNENLLYKRPDTSKAFYAEMRVTYRLLPEMNAKEIIDSSSFFIYDRSASDRVTVKPLYSNFYIKAKRGKDYHLELEISDVNRRTKYLQTLNVLKRDRLGRQNFLVILNDSISFRNSLLEGDDVTVKVSAANKGVLFVDCFKKEFGPAAPPFSNRPPDEYKYKPDSAFKLAISERTARFQMPAKGFYHLKLDSTTYEGLSLFTVDPSYPGVSNSLEMINCTRYIMFREEFEHCRDAADKKAAIDEFWLNVGGSLERARELLKRYYGRVKEANKQFSSYTQGWKTDRGMIYIVMGVPANIYRSPSEEIWMYGNETNPNALRFVFKKTVNPYSDNDYIMERSSFYKEPYHSAVEVWRQGLVYVDQRR
jgi:GWxTD domain-containing protein